MNSARMRLIPPSNHSSAQMSLPTIWLPWSTMPTSDRALEVFARTGLRRAGGEVPAVVGNARRGEPAGERVEGADGDVLDRHERLRYRLEHTHRLELRGGRDPEEALALALAERRAEPDQVAPRSTVMLAVAPGRASIADLSSCQPSTRSPSMATISSSSRTPAK